MQGGTLIDYNGQMRLLELAQVPKEYVRQWDAMMDDVTVARLKSSSASANSAFSTPTTFG